MRFFAALSALVFSCSSLAASKPDKETPATKPGVVCARDSKRPALNKETPEVNCKTVQKPRPSSGPKTRPSKQDK